MLSFSYIGYFSDSGFDFHSDQPLIRQQLYKQLTFCCVLCYLRTVSFTRSLSLEVCSIPTHAESHSQPNPHVISCNVMLFNLILISAHH